VVYTNYSAEAAIIMTRELDEKYICDECSEISVGEPPDWARKIFSAFPAFHSRNFQLYFYGQLISLIGTWLQVVAEGWLVLQLTNSPFLIGLVAALATLPSLLLSLFGGVLVDRFPKKTILLFTQSSSMVLALAYGILTIFHIITITEICILAFLLGVVNALDIPARQAFAVELVEREHLPSAIALNAGVFNAARVVGPAIAGLIIGFIGSGGAFILNGLSYIASIAALLLMHMHTVKPAHHEFHPLQAIKEGVIYSYSHPIIRTLLIFTGIVSIFGWSYSTVMPYIAQHTFHLNAIGLGYLYAAGGLGALAATFFVSSYGKKISPLLFILGGNTLFAVSLIFFTLTHEVVLALIFLFFAGVGLLSQFATMNIALQNLVDDALRGRVLSMYALMFMGLFPVGNFEVGFLSEHFSPQIAIQVGAVIVFLFGALVYIRRKNILTAYAAYKEKK